jgi:hypothetical protein
MHTFTVDIKKYQLLMMSIIGISAVLGIRLSFFS